jgi:hypothetical protein
MIGAFAIAKGAVDVFRTQREQSRYNQQLFAAANAEEYNSAVLAQQANTATMLAGGREGQQRRVASLVQGKIRASIGQSGTGYTGSNADIERQSQVFAELDALNIRYEGVLEAHNLRTQAQAHKLKAQAYLDQKLTGTDKFLGVAGAILGGVSSYYGATRGS